MCVPCGHCNIHIFVPWFLDDTANALSLSTVLSIIVLYWWQLSAPALHSGGHSASNRYGWLGFWFDSLALSNFCSCVMFVIVFVVSCIHDNIIEVPILAVFVVRFVIIDYWLFIIVCYILLFISLLFIYFYFILSLYFSFSKFYFTIPFGPLVSIALFHFSSFYSLIIHFPHPTRRLLLHLVLLPPPRHPHISFSTIPGPSSMLCFFFTCHLLSLLLYVLLSSSIPHMSPSTCLYCPASCTRGSYASN